MMFLIRWFPLVLMASGLFFDTKTTAFCLPRRPLFSSFQYSHFRTPRKIPLYASTQPSESTSDNSADPNESVDVCAATTPANGAPNTSAVHDGAPALSKKITHPKLDLPWNDAQEWALRDKFSKHTVQIAANNQETMLTNVLWRNLVLDTPELAGYPFPYLVDRLREASYKPANWNEEILPYLDNFCFESNGGISGLVYGIAGVADGTQIQTTPVGNVDVTIPRSFVQTSDGTIYELGQPLEKTSTLTNAATTQLEGRLLGGREQGSSDTDGALSVMDPELVNLGALTAMVVGSAWAVGALSHHLTVNVFWI